MVRANQYYDDETGQVKIMILGLGKKLNLKQEDNQASIFTELASIENTTGNI